MTYRTAYSRAPLRISFAGGGTDVSPYCDEFGGRVINATIARFVYCQISESENPSVSSLDLGLSSHTLDSEDTLPLHYASYRYLSQKYLNDTNPSISIQTYTDAPIGSGLGTSSTLVVSIVKAFSEFYSLGLNPYVLAEEAHVIEREICGFAGGRQDAYSAAFGGFNYMEFEKNHSLINQLRIPEEVKRTLEANLLLFFGGNSRESARIIKEQIESVSRTDSAELRAMHAIRAEASSMKSHLLRGDVQGIIDSINLGWANKKDTSKYVSNSQIDELIDAAFALGAKAARVSGAGGGGFILFWVPIMKREALKTCLAKPSDRIEFIRFTDEGAESWKRHESLESKIS